ncbi:formylglycine-generating enzyme family protein [Polyangium jinanense]|uniref:Sulfatase-modifying factor enzyme domain-containing protein n=1 Tax=Polyangium jinanense TaxID=2829994 RepID=A0A9X3X336_9BACT|nr:hypothetical protein [Polyangium jinanense]MDC3957340.1 hypothetical protein [Polyangium jinanense]MDC3982742.1 hypothetical protein [Polyangium jinanense]
MPLLSSAYSRRLHPRFAPLASREGLDALQPDARLALASEIARALGPTFAPVSQLIGAAGLPSLLHGPTKMQFVAVPGGTFVMGLSEAEIDEIAALYAPLGRADEARALVRWSTQPPRRVRVQPFLCALEPVTDRLAHARLADMYPDEDEGYVPSDAPVPFAPRLAAELRGVLGFRLLSEAEWEWIAREGGARSWLREPPTSISLALDPARDPSPHPNAFGVDLLQAGLEFVADAWHEGYAGAPADAIAWQPRAIPDNTRGCHGGFQDEIEAVRLHAGVREGRHGDDPAAVRFAIDLP